MKTIKKKYEKLIQENLNNLKINSNFEEQDKNSSILIYNEDDEDKINYVLRNVFYN